MTPRHLLLIALTLIPVNARAESIPLQPLVDATADGERLRLKPGVYAGPVRLTRSIHLDGGGAARVENAGEGTVITIDGNGITVQGLTIRGSGDQHEHIDAGIKARGRYIVVKDNVIENCLFGINFEQAHNSVIRRNTISSLAHHTLPQKGDAIRLWYSNDNLIEENSTSGARDSVVWYSKGNRVIGNSMTGGQYGLHFMYAHLNLAENNRFSGNVVGIFVMYGERNRLLANHIEYSQGPSGIGIGFKEASGTQVENNDILGNAVGMYLDASPYEPDLNNEISGNRFAFNGIAAQFHSEWKGNAFRSNDFVSNHTMVVVGGAGTAMQSLWQGNHYDSYEGFDRNKDGIGDTPMEAWSWADQLWMEVKDARFFRASPALEMIDFIERLIPFSQPRLMMRDASPRMNRIHGDRGSAGPQAARPQHQAALQEVSP